MDRKIVGLLLTLCLIFSSMVGCGRADRADIEADLDQQMDEATPMDSGTGDDAGEDEIPEHLSYTVNSELTDNKAVVEADVVSDGADSMCIYEIAKQDMNDDTLKAFAADFFDNGEYEVIKPYAISSKEELLNEQSYLVSLVGDMENYPSEIRNSELAYYLENYNESNVADMPEGTLFYEVPALYRVDAQGNPMQVKTCRLRGDVDGAYWELLCTQDCWSGDQMLPVDYYILKAYKLEPIAYQWDNISMDSRLENKCSAETAQKTAEAFMEKMGYADMTVLQTYQTYCSDTVDSLDGYKFRFGYDIDQIKTPQASELNLDSFHLLSYNGEINADTAACQCSAIVEVSSEGLTRVEIVQPYMPREKMSDSINSIQFEQADEIARTYIQKLLDDEKQEVFFGSVITNYDEVCLEYVNVQYEDGNNVLTPVWVYYGRPGSYISDYRTAVFGVMAIDGSIIELEEFYGLAGILVSE